MSTAHQEPFMPAKAKPSAPLTVDLRYRYDMLGRPIAIGTAEAPARYPAYAYDAGGSVVRETLASGARTFRRDPLGRLVGLDDPAFTQRLSFRQAGDAAKGFADGRI